MAINILCQWDLMDNRVRLTGSCLPLLDPDAEEIGALGGEDNAWKHMV